MELSELENEILKRFENAILKHWHPIIGREPYKTKIIGKKQKELLQGNRRRMECFSF
ncbi:hypothetical protein [Helicobacter pylori]|uniref:hypothetical protein n=1 Tax=Helicobacter pylori TaxID=210 RepID=UPI0039E0E101